MLLFLGVAILLLLVPTGAQAAGAKFRVLNAAVSGPVTVQVNGKTKISKLKLGRTSRRISLAAGRYTFSAKRGKKTVTALSVRLSRNERVTVVFAMKGKKPQLFLLREPRVSSGSILLRAANFASSAGAVDFRLGGLVIGRKVGFGGSTTVRKIATNFTLTGLVNVTARRSSKKTLTSGDPLVLAKGSVGLFAVIPRGSGSRLVRIPYDIPPPAPLKQPVIKGAHRFGSKLRCVGDAWRPKGAKVARRWTVDGAVKASGTFLTLTTAAHAGHTIGCAVSATSKGMTTTVAATFALPGVPTPLTAPSVKVPATALVAGSIVTCNTGTWTGAPTTFAVRWIRAATGLVVGTGRTYTLALPADNGAVNSLGCDVVATNTGGRSKPKASANTVALGIAPTVTIIARPLDITESTTATFDLAIGGGGANTVECSVDKAAFVPCLVTPSPTYSFPVAPGVNGVDHTFDVRVGNAVATAADTDLWKIVPLKPVVTITSGPPNPSTSPSASFTWTVTGGAATVTCRRDGVAAACGTLNGLATAINGVPHTFEVIATNANPGTPLSPTARDLYAWNVNPVAPTVAISSGPPNPTTSTSANFGLTLGGGVANVTCSIDGSLPGPCGPLSGLATDADGVSHTFNVSTSNITATATDSYTWIVNPPPATVSTVAVDPGDLSITGPFTVSFAVTGLTTSVTCQLDSGTPAPCTSGDPFPDPGEGPHTIVVRATNGSNNATGSGSQSWTYLPAPPVGP
jgi:hypothetical protein